jgi:hypothetical protein
MGRCASSSRDAGVCMLGFGCWGEMLILRRVKQARIGWCDD